MLCLRENSFPIILMEPVRGENFRNEFPGTDVSSIKPDFKNNVTVSFLITVVLSVESEWPDGPRRVKSSRKQLCLKIFSFFKLVTR